MPTDDSIIRQRLDEHSVVLVPTTPSVSRCADSILLYLNSVEQSNLNCENKQLNAIQSLDQYRLIIDRLPMLMKCLGEDLLSFQSLQRESVEKLKQLYAEKEILEKEVDSSINHLRQMNEIEKKSREVNEYSPKQELQKQLDQTVQSIERIEQETRELRSKMEDNRVKIMSLYTSFIKLKNEIFEVKMEEE